MKPGFITHQEYALIKTVEGYKHKEGRNVDQKREVTRIGDKKANPVSLSIEQVKAHSKANQISHKGDVMLS